MPSDLGRRIREARADRGLSIRQFAKLIEKSPTFVVLLETESVPPSTTDALLRAVSTALGISEDELFGLVRKVPEEALPTSAREVALFRRVQKMTDAEKEGLLRDLARKQKE